MTAENRSPFDDLFFLLEASKKLHGYLLHTWFKHYLDVIAGNLQRWIDSGKIGPDGRPHAERSGPPYLFDFGAIDTEKLTYILGFYVYIMASHKKANYQLMHDADAKRVLYLRGFDFEGATHAGGGMAVGYSSVDTTQFSHRLAGALRPEFEIFTALSPKDLFWETADAQRYFDGDYDGLVRFCSNPLRSIYLNAGHWQEDVAGLVDRIDAFVVYVSSITPSVLWELDLLKGKGRAEHTTVVFDERAIANKEAQLGAQAKMKEVYGDHVLWANAAPGATAPTADELRATLEKSFVVVSPDDFFGDVEPHKARMRNASGPANGEARAEPLLFRFYPALDTAGLQRVEDIHESTESSIRGQIESRTITNLPWFLNQVQLRIFSSLMLGRHDETGRAMAVYGAVMDVARKTLFANPASADEHEQRARRLLEQHFDMAEYVSPTLMAFGDTNEFGSYIAKARETYRELFASASGAVEAFFESIRH